MAFLSAYVTGSNALGLIAGVPSDQPQIATVVVGIGSVLERLFWVAEPSEG